MTDLSKIDFMQLKLEPVASSDVTSAQVGAVLAVYLGGVIAALKHFDEWQLSTHAAGLNRAQTNELWKRTEQVDEFIRQQSRQRVTILNLVKFLVDTERSVQLEKDTGFRGTYRFNRKCSILEIYEGGEWRHSTGMGDSSEVVTILD